MADVTTTSAESRVEEPAPGPSSPLPAPPPGEPPAPPRSEGQQYAWLFLVGLSVIVAAIDPMAIDLRPRQEVSIALLLGGGGLIGLGQWRHWPLVSWAGAAVLWISILGGIISQVSPLGIPPGTIWGPRGTLLVAAALGWLLFLPLPGWARRGVVAAAVPTLGTFAAIWLAANGLPGGGVPLNLSAQFYWLATDSRGTLYASDVDNGSVWVFDPGGGVRGKIWPARAPAPGQPGPGILPAGVGSELSAPQRQTGFFQQGTYIEQEFLFCGLTIDPQDHLYVVNLTTQHLMQFDREGQILATWPLPEAYQPARGCLAADRDHLYLADRRSFIQVYDHAGRTQATWEITDVPQGLAVTADGRLLILHNESLEFLNLQTGQSLTQWTLPPPPGALRVPYQAILARRNGEILVTDLANNQILRYGPQQQVLPPLGKPGFLPGEFQGLGGLAEDPAGRTYVSDFTYRVIQRFTADNQVQAVWSAPEDEINE